MFASMFLTFCNSRLICSFSYSCLKGDFCSCLSKFMQYIASKKLGWATFGNILTNPVLYWQPHQNFLLQDSELLTACETFILG